MNNTPETDAYLKKYCIDDSTDVVLLDFARKLERERDEARREADRQTEIANAMTEYMGDEAALIAERGQLKQTIEALEVRHAAIMMQTQNVVDENNQLRKVADELKNALVRQLPTSEKLSEIKWGAIKSHNSLPHVSQRTEG